MGDGKSLSDVTGQDQSIFNKNQAPTAQQTAANTFNKPATNTATQTNKTANADVTAKTDTTAKTGGVTKTGVTSTERVVGTHGSHDAITDLQQELSAEDKEYAMKLNGGDDKLGDRSENEVLNTGMILYDLAEDLGVANCAEKDWFEAASSGENKDKITMYRDTNQNGQIDDSDKLIDGDNSELRDGKYLDKDLLMQVDSERYGQVVISSGGDGNMNGADDRIISMGGQAASKSIEGGLKDATAPKDNTATTTEKATETKTATPKAAEEAKAVTNAPQVAQKAEANPVLGKLVDQVQDPVSLSDSNIKDLIAAIMLLINQNAA